MKIKFLVSTAKEILSSTEVSKAWNAFIGESSTCMKKINLTINGRKYFLSGRESELKLLVDLLSKSPRKYENFTLYAQKPGFLTQNVIDLLGMKNGKWKSVKIWSEKFTDEAQLEKLFHAIVDTVEDLDLRNINFMELRNHRGESFNFSKLKILSLCNVSKVLNNRWFLEKFKTCEKLEALGIEGFDVESNDALTNIIHNASRIQRLHVTQSNDKFFYQLSQRKLKELNNLRVKSYLHDSVYRTGLNHFLQVQADTITKLTLDAPISADVMRTVFQISTLKSLHILTPISYQVVELPPNPTIDEFRVGFECKSELLKSFTDAMPSLKVLKTDKKVLRFSCGRAATDLLS